eukprot:g4896.t1
MVRALQILLLYFLPFVSFSTSSTSNASHEILRGNAPIDTNAKFRFERIPGSTVVEHKKQLDKKLKKLGKHRNCALESNGSCTKCISLPDVEGYQNGIAQGSEVGVGKCGYCLLGAEGADYLSNTCIMSTVVPSHSVNCQIFLPNGSDPDTCNAPVNKMQALSESKIETEKKRHFPPQSDEDCIYDKMEGHCSPQKYCDFKVKLSQAAENGIAEAKCYATNLKKVPTLDKDCEWSWGDFGCSPSEHCEYRYHFGDLVLSDSCRLKNPPIPKLDEDCYFDWSNLSCAYGSGDKWKDTPYYGKCEYMYRLGDFTLSASCRISNRPTPKSDEDCLWNYSKFECRNSDVCEYHYRLWDFLLDTSCRLKKNRAIYPEPHPTRDEECVWDYDEMQCAYPGGGDRPIQQAYKGNAGVCHYNFMLGDWTLSHSCRLLHIDTCPNKPTTDEECEWNYRELRCECSEVCEYRFEIGDLTLSQSCRLQGGPTYEPPAPTNDDECWWDYKRMHCAWPEKCEFHMCLGDLTLGQSCRYKAHWPKDERTCSMELEDLSNPPSVDEDCYWDYRSSQCAHPKVCSYIYCLGDMTLDESCRINTVSRNPDATEESKQQRTCDKEDFAAERHIQIPRTNEDCFWDYAEGQCIYDGKYCRYHFCFGDLSISQSCRFIDHTRKEHPVRCSTVEAEIGEGRNVGGTQTREGAAAMLTSRLQALADASERRQILLRKSEIESKSWQGAVETVEDEDFQNKLRKGAKKYEQTLDAVGKMERQMLSKMKRGNSTKEDNILQSKTTSLAEKENAAQTLSENLSNLGNVGMIIEQTDRRAIEEACSAEGGPCASYTGNALWEDCLQDCLFSTPMVNPGRTARNSTTQNNSPQSL